MLSDFFKMMFSAKKETRDQHALLLWWSLTQRWAELCSHGRSLHWAADGSSPWSDGRCRGCNQCQSLPEAQRSDTDMQWTCMRSLHLIFCVWEYAAGKNYWAEADTFFFPSGKILISQGWSFQCFLWGFCVTLRLHFGCQRRNCVLPQDTWKLPLLVSVTQNRGPSLCTQYSL